MNKLYDFLREVYEDYRYELDSVDMEMAAGIILNETDKIDVFDHITTDTDVAYTLANYMKSGSSIDRGIFLKTIKDCVSENMKEQIEDAFLRVKFEVDQERSLRDEYNGEFIGYRGDR